MGFDPRMMQSFENMGYDPSGLPKNKLVCKLRFTDTFVYVIALSRFGRFLIGRDGKLLGDICKDGRVKIEGLTVVGGANPYVRSVGQIPEHSVNCKWCEISDVRLISLRKKLEAMLIKKYGKYTGVPIPVVDWLVRNPVCSDVRKITENVRGVDLLTYAEYSHNEHSIVPAKLAKGGRANKDKWWLLPMYDDEEVKKDANGYIYDAYGHFGYVVTLPKLEAGKRYDDYISHNDDRQAAYGIRPVLELSSGVFRAGEKLEFGGHVFTVLERGRAALSDTCWCDSQYALLPMMRKSLKECLEKSKKAALSGKKPKWS